MKISKSVSKTLALSTVTLAIAVAVGTRAQSGQEGPPMRGPFWSGTVMRSKGESAANKGLAITLGTSHSDYAVYDLDTMRLAVAWSGEFLEFGNTLTKIEWPPPPTVKGDVAFFTGNGPGWADTKGNFTDPRANQQGPLPKNWAHYEGLYVNGEKVILKYTLGGTEVLESPGVEIVDGHSAFSRTLQFEHSVGPTKLVLESGWDPKSGLRTNLKSDAPIIVGTEMGHSLTLRVTGLPHGAELTTTPGGLLVLNLPALKAHSPFQIVMAGGAQLPALTKLPVPKLADLRVLTKGGPAHWGGPLSTQGKISTDEGPYVVDILTEPFPNPYRVSTFFGGFDFLPDGRAAICTFHGDVWIVSGLADPELKLKWKRYASGLFQPLGLKVVKGEIYVAGRDQLTRLRDLNGDGEADSYENFNNDTVVTPNYHEFVLDLHTDSKGNFFYAKGAPWEPAVSSPHQGTILKVSPNGKKLEIYATGLRAPNGMTVGPGDTILVGDNQGHWMPSSKLNLVKPGSFMGMVPSAQRELKLRYTNGTEIVVNPSDPAARKKFQLKGWEAAMPIPVSYDEPICWLPMRWDNSSGGQVYVTSDKWGPWKGAPLFMSYGKCLLYGVLWDKIEGTVQASMVPFGLKFPSGIMRGRFNPADGQLYVCGLKGWQNSATRDGGFYRVRYTQKPVHMATRAHAAENGLQLTFATELEAKAAVDTGNYAVELWNYRYSGAYGSPEVSVKTPGKIAHDRLDVRSVRFGADKRSVFLEIDGLVPADQFSVRYTLLASDGTEMKSEVIGTIHKLGAAVN